MTQHPYLFEKLVAMHQAEIRHDIEQSRMSAHTGQWRTIVRFAAGRLGTLLIALGSQLQRAGQRREAPLHAA